ncbi:MAG: hypothetical protein IK071_03120 [Lachnospiraceae bacterium]|nr:hypothetical protein [Lachnospiraceae bacterium]
MVSAKSMEVRDNFKDWCVQAAEGEVIQISRPGNNYVYLISHETYEKLTRERRIAAYASYLHGKDKITNLKRLAQIENLPENWNNNGAERISGNIIKTVRKLLMGLEFQPEIFPTACDAVQLEWENKNDEYLEMEVLEDSINVFQIDSEGGEHQNTIATDGATVKKIVREFYDRAV